MSTIFEWSVSHPGLEHTPDKQNRLIHRDRGKEVGDVKRHHGVVIRHREPKNAKEDQFLSKDLQGKGQSRGRFQGFQVLQLNVGIIHIIIGVHHNFIIVMVVV